MQQEEIILFLSRGLHKRDRKIGDTIADVFKSCGYKVVTVGVEIVVPGNKIPEAVKESIKRSHAVVAVATRRYWDCTNANWRISEWIHSEVAMAYITEKPIVILKEKGVKLGGLLECLEREAKKQKSDTVREFDPQNPQQIRKAALDAVEIVRTLIRERDSIRDPMSHLPNIAAGIITALIPVVLIKLADT